LADLDQRQRPPAAGMALDLADVLVGQARVGEVQRRVDAQRATRQQAVERGAVDRGADEKARDLVVLTGDQMRARRPERRRRGLTGRQPVALEQRLEESGGLDGTVETEGGKAG